MSMERQTDIQQAGLRGGGSLVVVVVVVAENLESRIGIKAKLAEKPERNSDPVK